MRAKKIFDEEKLVIRLQESIDSIPDFPAKGVVFRDLSPVWKDSSLCHEIVASMASRAENKFGGCPDVVVGIESRGFILGMPLSLHWDIPFIPFRKPGKLPGVLLSEKYELEYGFAELQCQVSCIQPGMKVVIHDDVLATGGTARAAQKLVEQAGAEVVAFVFIIELPDLQGRNGLAGLVHSMVEF